MIEILYARTEDVGRETLLSGSDPETLERVKACMRPGRGEEIALGRYLARLFLAKRKHISFEEVVLAHTMAGRPYFKGRDEHVSISRDRGAAIALVGQRKAVCDMQSIRRFPGAAVRGFFSQAEYERIRKAEDPDLEMTRIFSQRECMVKWLGHRPDLAGWDAEEMRKQMAPDAKFTETQWDGHRICVLGPDEELQVFGLHGMDKGETEGMQ